MTPMSSSSDGGTETKHVLTERAESDVIWEAKSTPVRTGLLVSRVVDLPKPSCGYDG